MLLLYIMGNQRKSTNKYNSQLCTNQMTFQECEMAILRNSVDTIESKKGEKVANSPEVVKIIKIVEDFLLEKKLVCYGGTAINNILPKSAQFYDKNMEIPDYDFFSPTAMEHAKELADIYYDAGYDEVEAKAGVHEGTYKVFVNFIPVADITYLHPVLYKSLSKDSINVAGIHYAPANYLRMGMFLELSRPDGDVSRWEKVLKRINLLNKHHPLKSAGNCHPRKARKEPGEIYEIARNAFIDQGVVFFGGYALSLYADYMPEETRSLAKHTPDFDVLAEDPERCAAILKEMLAEKGFHKVRLIQHTPLGEVVPQHIEVVVGSETVAFIYKPIACHSYNTITIADKEINVATIDTMLSFYLAFMYADKKYYNKERILCMSVFLFEIEQENRLAQKGLLKRFSTSCYGTQETLDDIRLKKTRRYKQLSSKRGTVEYDRAFLKYDPRTNAKIARPKQPTKSHTPSPSIHKTFVIANPRISSRKKSKKERESKHETKQQYAEKPSDEPEKPNNEPEKPSDEQPEKPKQYTRKRRNWKYYKPNSWLSKQ